MVKNTPKTIKEISGLTLMFCVFKHPKRITPRDLKEALLKELSSKITDYCKRNNCDYVFHTNFFDTATITVDIIYPSIRAKITKCYHGFQREISKRTRPTEEMIRDLFKGFIYSDVCSPEFYTFTGYAPSPCVRVFCRLEQNQHTDNTDV